MNLNDTIVSCDTIAVRLVKMTELSQPVINEAETNSQDVLIVGIICGAIALLAITAGVVITKWHNKEAETLLSLEDMKAKNDKEFREREAAMKDAEEKNRLSRYYQKTVFDKIISKRIEEETISNENDEKSFYKKMTDFMNSILCNFK